MNHDRLLLLNETHYHTAALVLKISMIDFFSLWDEASARTLTGCTDVGWKKRFNAKTTHAFKLIIAQMPRVFLLKNDL